MRIQQNGWRNETAYSHRLKDRGPSDFAFFFCAAGPAARRRAMPKFTLLSGKFCFVHLLCRALPHINTFHLRFLFSVCPFPFLRPRPFFPFAPTISDIV